MLMIARTTGLNNLFLFSIFEWITVRIQYIFKFNVRIVKMKKKHVFSFNNTI